jgi:DNA replication ATP-dependent helicase Dna2
MHPPDPPLHLTATRIAEYFRFGCERQLRYDLVPSELRAGNLPGSETGSGPQRNGPGPGSALLLAVGKEWERRKLRHLYDRFDAARVLVAGWTPSGDPLRLPYDAVVDALKEPGEVELLVQPELRVSNLPRFARRFGIDPARVHLAPAAPDLIRIRRTSRGTLFQVIDIKASKEARISHFAQIAFYTLLLEEICAAERVETGKTDTRWGRVWARDGRGPARVALGAYRHHVARFLREDVQRIEQTAPASCAWHLTPRCTGCGYFDHCRREADSTDDLSRIVGITPLAKQVLHAKGIRTVRELATSFRRDTYTGCHALESQSSQLKQRAQALRYGKVFDVERSTHLMGPQEDLRVILTAESDPVTGLCFALGIRADAREARRSDGERGRVFLATSGTPAAERKMLRAWLVELGAVFRMGQEVRHGSGGRAATVHVFVYDRTELGLLRGLFQRHIAEPGTQPALDSVLQILSPDRGNGNAGGPQIPGTVLVDVVAALFAPPVPYSYDLSSLSACLAPPEDPWVHSPSADYSRPLSSQVPFERIHDVWQRCDASPDNVRHSGAVRDEIQRTVTSKLAAIDSVIRAVRGRDARAPRLLLRAEPLTAGGAEGPIADPTLEALRVFTEMEAAEQALAIRALHALPAVERAQRFECIRGLELVDRRDDGSLVFEFDAGCRDVKFRPGDFNLVLTNDDGRTLLDTDRQPWKRRALMVELVEFDLVASPPRVVLAPGSVSAFAKAERDGWLFLDRRCVLDRSSSDFNTHRVISTLRHLAAGAGEAAFVLDLLAGATASDDVSRSGRADFARCDILLPAAGAMGRPVLNPDQERAWRAALDQRLTLIWGPPGTGKTYLLAWALMGVAAAARAEKRPCRILVTAATHRAITNVLSRASRELQAAGIAAPFQLVKLRGSGSEADADLAGSLAELVPDTQLPALLRASDERGEPIVIGSTVWSLWKQMKASSRDGSADGDAPEEVVPGAPIRPWFDVVVIDEASQMRVADALIGLSAIRHGGQVILCGDDKQLAPIVRGQYDAQGSTLFGSVFSHFAANVAKMPLWESRRMNDALVRYPRRLFYPGLVSMCPAQRIALGAAALPDDPVDRLFHELFLQPDDAVVFCTYAGVRATARNPFEAQTVARIARLARTAHVDPETGEGFSDERFASHGLAVISPHRAQNSAILAELLTGGFSPGTLPVVDTVERMQGNEREMILVSYAVADREYAEREAEFLLNPNRFNVSITRARSKLIVFMSEAVLDALPSDEATLTESMAIKGYSAHCADAVREAQLPDGQGGQVRVRCHYRTLARRHDGAAIVCPGPESLDTCRPTS